MSIGVSALAGGTRQPAAEAGRALLDAADRGVDLGEDFFGRSSASDRQGDDRGGSHYNEGAITLDLEDEITREAEVWMELGLHPNIVSCYFVRKLGGIPRIFVEYVEGGTLYDVYEAMGYAVATDRLWQMDIYRRTARGKLSEILGSAGLQLDVPSRIMGYSDDEFAAQFAGLSADGDGEMVPAHPFVWFYIWKLVEQQQITYQEKRNQGCHK